MAVYTHVGARALEEFLKSYDVGSVLAFKSIAEGVENSNYFLRTERAQSGVQNFILTLYEDRMDEQGLPFMLGLMNHLFHQGFPCAEVKADKEGHLFRSLEGRPATLIRFLEGVSFSDPTPLHCRRVGEALAEMHGLGEDYKTYRQDPVPFKSWKKVFAECSLDNSQGLGTQGLREEIERDLEEIIPSWPSDLPKGSVHGDLFPDNVLFQREDPHFIDFSFANTNFYASDLAICMNAWGIDNEGRLRESHMLAFLEGYHARRKLSGAEQDALPFLARAAAMQFFLMRLRAQSEEGKQDALVRLKNPKDYLTRLRFHRKAQSLADYGLAPLFSSSVRKR